MTPNLNKRLLTGPAKDGRDDEEGRVADKSGQEQLS
jgi:hypothetical protein